MVLSLKTYYNQWNLYQIENFNAKKKLLDQIQYPADLRKLKKEDLKQLSKELRGELIDVVSTTG